MNNLVFHQVEPDTWLPGGLSFESASHIFITPILGPPSLVDPAHELFLINNTELVLPEIDGASLVLPGNAGGASLQIFMSEEGVGRIAAPLILRLRSDILRPLKPGTDQPDLEAEYLDIDLGQVSLLISSDGSIGIEGVAGIAVPRCMVGTTGLIVSATGLRWVSAEDNDPFTLAPGAPGVALDGVTVELPGALPGVELSMKDVFIGAGGFWGKVAVSDPSLTWNGSLFEGTFTGNLFGFPGGLHKVGIELRQSALVGARLQGEVFLPFLDTPVGLTLGLDGNGGFTASAGPAHSSGGAQASASALFNVDIGDFLSMDITSLAFSTTDEAAVTLGGRLQVNIPALEIPAIEVTALRIDQHGKVSAEGGWLDLRQAVAARFGGFPLELTRVGFGSEEGSSRRWLGVNGGIRLAAGLPAGATVEGLRMSWDQDATDIASSLQVSLDGVGVELAVEGAFRFVGRVGFFDDSSGSGFRGLGKLSLTALGMEVEAGLVVGRTHSGDTFFYFHLNLELPTGIPLFTTGAAIYGLAGLVADDMAPNRAENEDWYWDWYARPEKGATDPGKWGVEPGTFAAGLGATIGTAFDDGFTFNTRCLLVLVLPGPRVLMSGSGSFLTSRKSDGEGAFDALLVLDTPGRLFQANLAASYEVPVLISARGGIDVGFSWASPMPADLWHVYLGQYEPRERRVGATWLDIFTAEAWLMVDRRGLDLGGWAGMDETFGFPPAVSVRIAIGVDGRGRVAWDPVHFMGELYLGGTVSVSAFGVGATLTAGAGIEAQAPTPYWLIIELLAELEVDLFLFSLGFSHTIVLEFGDRNRPLPKPSPPIQRIAFEHERLRANLPAQPSGLVPPDVRPVVIFRRPMRDPSGIASPAVPVSEDKVGEFRYYHELGSVALHRDGVGIRSASGMASISGDSVEIAGNISLQGAQGGLLELIDVGTFRIEAINNHSITLDRDSTVTRERVGYRLHGPTSVLPVNIVSVGDARFDTREITLQAPLAASQNLPGGELVAPDGSTWRILQAGDDQVVVRQRSDGQLPGPGTAELRERTAPALEGAWLAGTDDDLGGTRLMLWASSPFAWFRSNDPRTTRPLEDSNTACGPRVEEKLVCINLHPDELRGPKDALIRLNTSGEVNFVRVDGANRAVLGPRPGTRGSLTLSFDPPVDRVEIRSSLPDEFEPTHKPDASVTASREGQAESTQALIETLTVMTGSITALTLEGRNTHILQVCFAPQWQCFKPAEELETHPGVLDEAAFPGLAITARGSHSRAGSYRVFAGIGRNPLERLSDTRNRGPFGRHLRDFRRGRFLNPELPPRPLPGLAELLERPVSVVIDFERPVTRVRLKLGSVAEIQALSEDELVTGAHAQADETVLLDSREGYIDRIVISGDAPLQLGKLCWDGGDLGRQRRGRARWTRSLSEAVERFSDESAVLDPGAYRVEVAALTTVIAADGTEQARWSHADQRFEVGPPPGLGTGNSEAYPDAGPLALLSSYVKKTLPRAGGRPFYRGDDTGVAFLENYVSRLYLAAEQPLSMQVFDATGKVIRSAAHNHWGGTQRQLRTDEEAWVAALHIGNRCISVALDRVALDETLNSGGQWLSPERLHSVQLRAGGRALYSFDFISSRYGSFHHHIAHSRRHLFEHGSNPAGPALAPLLVTLEQQRSAFTRIQDDLQRLVNRTYNSPTRPELDQRADLEQQLEQAVKQMRQAEELVFAELASAHDIPVQGGLPLVPELKRLPGGLLLESPEPLHSHRLRVGLYLSTREPRRLREILFERRVFGEPDAGKTLYQGLQFTSSLELRCRGGRVSPAVDQPWTLEIGGQRWFGLEVTLDLKEGGQAGLAGSGTGVSATQDSPAGAQGEVVLKLDADNLETATLSGQGFSITRLRVVESSIAPNPQHALRIEEIQLPAADGDVDHFVALTALSRVDLGGMTLTWDNALKPVGGRPYHAFASEVVEEGERIIVQGSRTQTADVDRARVRAGGAVGAPSADGMSIELRDQDGKVLDACGRLADPYYAPAADLILVANLDQTRLALLSASADLATGHGILTFDYRRDAGRPWVVQTVGGSRRGSLYILTLAPR